VPRASANDIEIEYEILGDRGEPLLLIMGLGAQMIHWPDALCHRFIDAGFQLIRFDNRDVGRSTRFDHAGRVHFWPMFRRSLLGLPVEVPYRLDDMADDAAGLLEAIGVDSAHVLGASLGGMIAQTLAIRHPARVKSLTSIMSTPGGRRYGLPAPRALRALLRKPPATREEAGESMVQLFRVIGSPGFFRDETILRDIGERSFDRGPSPAGMARQLGAVMASGSRARALRYVDAPALVIHGTEDPLIRPLAGRATARAIPGARLEMIAGMGHDIAGGIWPILVDRVAALVSGAGYTLDRHAVATLA
jgi:pimeloyl-ACP methyl ester carboxylesterase